MKIVLAKTDESHSTTASEPSIMLAEFKKKYKNGNKSILADYDGTLAQLEKKPDMAIPTSRVLSLLKKHPEIIICTGRSCEKVDEWFPMEVECYAEHGAMHRKDGIWDDVKAIDRQQEGFKTTVLDIMNYYRKRTPNSSVEEKSCGAAFHYRQCGNIDKIIQLMYCELSKLGTIMGFMVSAGKKVVEVKLGSKGKIVDQINPGVVAGDDLTDEDMFEHSENITIKVGKDDTKADYYLQNTGEMITLLEELMDSSNSE